MNFVGQGNKHTASRQQSQISQRSFQIGSLFCTYRDYLTFAIANMPPPSKLAVATGSVTRLVKEEASYHKELIQQEERIKKLEASEGDENKEYTLRQEVSLHVSHKLSFI